jgi:hypothetical protein
VSHKAARRDISLQDGTVSELTGRARRSSCERTMIHAAYGQGRLTLPAEQDGNGAWSNKTEAISPYDGHFLGALYRQKNHQSQMATRLVNASGTSDLLRRARKTYTGASTMRICLLPGALYDVFLLRSATFYLTSLVSLSIKRLISICSAYRSLSIYARLASRLH